MGKKTGKKWTKLHVDWGVRLAREMGTDPEVDEDDLEGEGDFDAEVRGEIEAFWFGPLLGVADPASLAPGAHPDDLAPLLQAMAELRKSINEMDNFAMQRALQGAVPHDFDAMLRGISGAVAARTVEAQRIAGEAKARTAPPDADKDQTGAIELARQRVTDCLAPIPLSARNVQDASDALGALDTTIREVAEAIRMLCDALAEIDRQGGEVVQAGHLKDQKDRLKIAREELATALKGPPMIGTRDTAAKALQRLRDVAEAVRIEIEEFGGTGAIDGLCAAFGATVDDLAAIEAKFGGRKAMQALLKAVPAPDLKVLHAGMGADRLAATVAAFGTPMALAEAAKGLGGPDKVVGLCTLGGSDPVKGKKLIDDLGSGFVGALMDGGADPKTALDIQGAFGGNVAPLKDLVKEGGFETKPKALAGLFTTGCDGKSSEFVTFCKGFDTKESREDMAGLVGDGGLGDAPEAFGALLKQGCGGKPAGLKAMGTAFRDPAARAGLKGLLEDGGLKGQVGGDGDIGAGTLAMMLKHGAGPRPNGAVDPEEKRTAEGLARLAKGMSKKEDCTRLKDTLAKGGLGADPEVFGQLLGHGCGAGDPAKLNALTTELAAAGRNAKLKDMLQKGGFGTKDDASVATGTDTTCLGKLFGKGCEARVADVSTLLDALQPADIANMKGIMKSGELGKHPDVMANLYKHGCINAPSGADDGVKNPAILKTMMTSFSPPVGNPGQFKALLTTGGFTANGKEERLGSVMRYAFTPKRPANQPQNGQGLKQLHTAFNGNMGDLATTMDALETAPPHVLEAPVAGTANQPGKGLQNVVSSPKHNGSAANLRAGFFTPLKNRATGGGAPASMGLPALLQTAASFEHDRSPTPDVTVGNPPNNKSLRVDHIVERHSRTHGRLTDAPGGPFGETTLYPKDVGAPEVAAKAGQVIPRIPNPNNGNRPGYAGGGPKRNPPQDRFDLAYVPPNPPHPASFFSKYNGMADNGGMTHRIGYARDGGGNDVKITQFFPQGPIPPLVKVNNRDMAALRAALI